MSRHELFAAPPTGTSDIGSAEAENCFLQRGLPAVLTTWGRWRRPPAQPAPVLTAYATIQACGLWRRSGAHVGGPYDALAPGDRRRADGPVPAGGPADHLVFFNSYVWLMAVKIDAKRLWLALAFLVFIAGIFVTSAVIERVRPMLRSTAALPEDNEKLADTPFAEMPDPPADAARVPLKKDLVLGVILLNPALLKE